MVGCIDCPPGLRRRVTRPGPRCATHQRARKARNRNTRASVHLQTTYGITEQDYQKIYAEQGGRCYICERATGRTKRLSVDHDHATGVVRGLLCTTCNRDVIGHLRDSTEALQRAIEYLNDPPAVRVLGERVVP